MTTLFLPDTPLARERRRSTFPGNDKCVRCPSPYCLDIRKPATPLPSSWNRTSESGRAASPAARPPPGISLVAFLEEMCSIGLIWTVTWKLSLSTQRTRRSGACEFSNLAHLGDVRGCCRVIDVRLADHANLNRIVDGICLQLAEVGKRRKVPARSTPVHLVDEIVYQ